MNLLLANMLAEYGGEFGRVSAALQPQPPQIHLTTLPHQIRNLSTPMRFLQMPDLEIFPGLDAPIVMGAHGGPFASAVAGLDAESALSDLDAEFEASLDLRMLTDELADDFSDGLAEDGATLASDAAGGAGGHGSSNGASSSASMPLERDEVRRLLLGLASHNPTNRNTFVRMGGIPLRRQNAIRVKPRDLSPQKPLLEVARDYHLEFQAAVRQIKALDLYVGACPLFCTHRHGKRSSRRRSGSFEAQMDKFTSLCRKRQLFRLEEADTAGGAAENPGNLRGGEPRQDAKRPSGQEARGRQKRRKLQSSNGPSASVHRILPGDELDISNLSDTDKYRIIDGLRCSYLTGGSSFRLGLTPEWILERGNDKVELNFNHVDYDAKTLHGTFLATASNDRSGNIHLILTFILFLCGGPRLGYAANCLNRIIQAKLALLNEAFMAVIVERGLLNPKVFECLTQPLHVPFSGEIVDFNKNDLRFFSKSATKGKSSFRRHIHMSKVRNEQVKLQLSEWLRIRPFHNFLETFFLNYLFFIEQYLANFDKAPKAEQELALEFVKNMHQLVYDITKNFLFVNKVQVPLFEERFSQAKKEIWERKRHEPRSHLHKSLFLENYESKLIEKLCELVTCRDACSLNIQLNYVLFTVRVDVSEAIDTVFSRLSALVTRAEDRKTLERKFNALKTEQPALNSRETVFVCSLNRKTGRLEMQNTRLHLDYQCAGLCGARSLFSQPTFGSMTIANLSESENEDDDDHELSTMGTFSTGRSANCKYLEDPYLMGNPTVVAGSWRRNAPGSYGGRFDFA